MDGLIREHGGRIANTAGDSVLAEFPSVVDAVECAISIQEKLRRSGLLSVSAPPNEPSRGFARAADELPLQVLKEGGGLFTA